VKTRPRLESGATQSPSVESGDRVLVGKRMGPDVKLDADEHIILREDDILATVHEEE
jgi:chaperonin GroES